MNRETALTAAALLVVAGSLLVAATVPGAVADPTTDLRRPGHVAVADVAIEPGQVTGATATLQVEARLDHGGNPTENVSVRFRAVDSDSGFVAAERTVSVGTLTEDREVPVRTNLTVKREGGYRIDVVVYRDGERIESGTVTVAGLEGLTPPYARSSVRFTERQAVPPVSFTVAEVSGNRTTLSLSAAVTNEGDVAPSEDLEVTFVLRQAESNIVAARETVPVGDVRPGRTATVDADVTVPSEYNYYVDVVLWKDGVLVDSARAAANLDPTKTIEAGETEQEIDLRVSDFESKGTGGQSPETPQSSSQAPGFGALPAVVALAVVAVALLSRRWER